MDVKRAKQERGAARERARRLAAKRCLNQVEKDWYEVLFTLATGVLRHVWSDPRKLRAAMKALERRELVERADVLLQWRLTEKGLMKLARHRADPVMLMEEPQMRDYYLRLGLA